MESYLLGETALKFGFYSRAAILHFVCCVVSWVKNRIQNSIETITMGLSDYPEIWHTN